MKKYLILSLLLILMSCKDSDDFDDLEFKKFDFGICENITQNDMFMNYETGKEYKYRTAIFQNDKLKYRKDTVIEKIVSDTLLNFNGELKSAFLMYQITNINNNIDTGKVALLKCDDYFNFYFNDTIKIEDNRVRFIFDPKLDRIQKYKINGIEVKCKGYKQIEVNNKKYNAFEVLITNIDTPGFGNIVQNFYVKGLGLIQSRNYTTYGDDESKIYNKNEPYILRELILEN